MIYDDLQPSKADVCLHNDEAESMRNVSLACATLCCLLRRPGIVYVLTLRLALFWRSAADFYGLGAQRVELLRC